MSQENTLRNLLYPIFEKNYYIWLCLALLFLPILILSIFMLNIIEALEDVCFETRDYLKHINRKNYDDCFRKDK